MYVRVYTALNRESHWYGIESCRRSLLKCYCSFSSPNQAHVVVLVDDQDPNEIVLVIEKLQILLGNNNYCS